MPKTRVRNTDRVFWLLVARRWKRWKATLVIVKLETVIAWHRKGFRLFWGRKSRPLGRPTIPALHLKFIRRMSFEHPEWGEDKIALELSIKFGIRHSTSTIRKYMVRTSSPSPSQTWKTFIKNHGKDTFACDFLTQHTAFFNVVYIFVVMELRSRRIIHSNVTTNPSLAWVKQQIREATPFGSTPKFFIHDNDGIFGQLRTHGQGLGHRRPFRSHLDQWLSEAMSIRGIPIPYGAPNTNARLERFNRTLRREALNHFIFLNDAHIRRVIHEYLEYYNRARPSQATDAIPVPYPELQDVKQNQNCWSACPRWPPP